MQEGQSCLYDFKKRTSNTEKGRRRTAREMKQLRRNAHESIIKEVWRTDGGQRDPYCAFVKYVEHQPKDGKVTENL